LTRQQQEKKDQVTAAGVHTGERPLPFQEYLKKSRMRKIFFYQSAYHTPDFSPHNLDVYTSKHTTVAGGVLHEDQLAALKEMNPSSSHAGGLSLSNNLCFCLF
jgi:hypothetical protein